MGQNILQELSDTCLNVSSDLMQYRKLSGQIISSELHQQDGLFLFVPLSADWLHDSGEPEILCVS